MKINPSHIAELESYEGPKILLLTAEFVNDMNKEESDLVFSSDNSNAVICIQGDQNAKIAKSCNEEKVFLYLKEPVEEVELLRAIKSGFSFLHSKLECGKLHSALDTRTRELSSLNEIGIALSSEQDYDELLNLILSKSREVTNCDAGSLYLLSKINEKENSLVFKLVQNDSLANLEFKEYSLPLTRSSLAGYVALTGEFLNLEDVYDIPEDADYTFNKAFDI